MDDIQWWMPYGCATQDCDEAKDHIDGELELNEFSNVVIESSQRLTNLRLDISKSNQAQRNLERYEFPFSVIKRNERFNIAGQELT